MNKLEYQVDLLNAINKKLRRDEKMLRLICETSNSAFLYYNYEEEKVQTIANWDHFFDFTIQDIRDLTKLYDCVEEKYMISLREVLFIEKQGIKSQSIEIRLKENRICIEVEVNIVYDDNSRPTDKIIRFKDVTKFNAQNDELTYMAYYDILTGLYNRNYFVRLLGEFVRRAGEENETVAVMFLDVDDFRKINDGMGIIVGDELVQLFGQYLIDLMGDNVVISHFNSDIYCIGIYGPYGARSVETIYQSIKERLKKPFRLTGGQEIFITVSVGVAEFPEAASNTLELINCAEIVMFKAKSMGKDKIQYFDGAILNDFLQNVTIENKLKEAVFAQNFIMYFQPQFRTTDKELRGVEALIRWKDDTGDMISPAVFIPIAEKNGTIVPIGTWVIEESLKAYADWRRKYHYPMIMSINISAIQYKQPDFIEKLLHILEKYQISPYEIELEITESIIYMVKKLGFETVAEGVETEEQFKYLNEISCDIIQGYYLGKPMPADDIEKLLTSM